MKIITLFLPETTPLVDLHRAAALLGCYVKPTHEGGYEVLPKPKPRILTLPHRMTQMSFEDESPGAA